MKRISWEDLNMLLHSLDSIGPTDAVTVRELFQRLDDYETRADLYEHEAAYEAHLAALSEEESRNAAKWRALYETRHKAWNAYHN